MQGEAAQRLGPAQGERMLAQLREVRGGAEGTPAQPGTPTGGPGRSPQPRFPDSPPNQAAPHGGTPAGGLDTHAACPSHLQPAAGQATAQPGMLSSSLAEPGTGGSPSGARETLPSSPGAARPAGATGGGKDWAGLGQAWSASARQRLAQLWQRVQSGEALGEWDQSHVAAAALGGAVLLYAAVAERRAVSQGLRRWVAAWSAAVAQSRALWAVLSGLHLPDVVVNAGWEAAWWGACGRSSGSRPP